MEENGVERDIIEMVIQNIEYEIKDGKGHIKEYGNNGELEFEGEYLNGIRNGKGKEYVFNGEIKFEGEYLNGERNGKEKNMMIMEN